MLIEEPVFQLLKNTINKEGWLKLPAFGNSMYPFITEGDLCTFSICNPLSLKRGDVILVHTSSGKLIAHRFIKRTTEQLFLLKGDTNLGFDEPIKIDQILGKLVSVKKQHLNLIPDQIVSRIWGELILTFPILSGILRKYLNGKVKLQY